MWKPSPIDNLEELVQTVKPNFSGFSIAPTFKCDSRCKFCHTWGDKGWASDEKSSEINKEIDFNALCNFINQANLIKTRDRLKCTISGGESLMYSKFDELAYFLKKSNIFNHVITNGYNLSKHALAIAECVEELTVSLNGPPEIDNEIRGCKNHFEDTCDGIEELLKLKIKNNNPFPHIRVNYVLSKHTQDHIEDFVKALSDRFKNMGTEIFFDYEVAIENPEEFMSTRKNSLINGIAILFEPLLFTNNDQGALYENQLHKLFGVTPTTAWKGLIEENIGIDIPRLRNTLNKLWKKHNFDDKSFIDLEEYFADVTSVFGRTRCLTPWHYVRIRPDGSVNFCSDLPDFIIGNLYHESFLEIWEGKKADQFRKVMQKQLLSMCYRCDGLMCISEEHLGIKTVSL